MGRPRAPTYYRHTRTPNSGNISVPAAFPLLRALRGVDARAGPAKCAEMSLATSTPQKALASKGDSCHSDSQGHPEAVAPAEGARGAGQRGRGGPGEPQGPGNRRRQEPPPGGSGPSPRAQAHVGSVLRAMRSQMINTQVWVLAGVHLLDTVTCGDAERLDTATPGTGRISAGHGAAYHMGGSQVRNQRVTAGRVHSRRTLPRSAGQRPRGAGPGGGPGGRARGAGEPAGGQAGRTSAAPTCRLPRRTIR